jgi:hypothetical protein
MESLLRQLADIERQMEDKTLSHSDQQLLDQAWEDINGQLNELDDIEEPAAVTVAVEEVDPDEWEDDRGCANCAGCAYCMTAGGGYDDADEV